MHQRIRMKRFIVCVAFLVTDCLLVANAEKFVYMVPRRQIRRSPTLSVPSRPNVRAATPYLKYPTFGSYGLARPSLPPNNQLPHGIGEYERPQNNIDHTGTPYGKSVGYAPYARGYLPYDKKGGLVPFINQHRYPVEPARPRLPPGLVYGPTSVSNGYYHRPINNDPYVADKNLPIRPQPSDRPIHTPFTGNHQRPPTGVEDQTISQKQIPQPAASSNYPKMGTIIVTPSSVGNQQQGATRTGDLAKESSNAVSKVPSTSAIGAGKGGIVLRDTILLGDYEKKFAEFTKSWPKLSAFSGAFGDASSFFRGSSLNPSISSGLARSSDNNIDTSNSIGRQGYAVKEEIDEPPFDFRSNPIIASPLHVYPTPTSAFFRHLG